MKKETIKYIIQLIVAVLTAIGSTLSVTTAASGAPAEGVARHMTACGRGLNPVPTTGNGSLRSKSFKNLIQNHSRLINEKFMLNS